MEKNADIGLIGLAVMGQNLVLNMNDHGYTVAVFNRTVKKVDDFLSGAATGRDTVLGAGSVEQLAAMLKRPRKIMLMVKAGPVVDSFIEMLLPFLEEGDCIIDGGNSHYADTNRRTEYLAQKGILYIGTGVSGGEEGARRGPSIMPGGNPKAWPLVKEMFQTICAKTDTGEPCCDWVGEKGAGHFVKMVHNGIEYGDMQIICEAYHLMRDLAGLGADEMSDIFDLWNRGPLDSYLIQITRDILAYKDEKGEPQLDSILDSAGQKGTGKWTGISSLELGVPVTLIGEAVFARSLSSLKDERIKASKLLVTKNSVPVKDKQKFVDDLEKALLASKIVSYAQGFMLMREAAGEYGWSLDYGAIALMWRGGCIIRSAFLQKIKNAFDKESRLQNLLLDDYFRNVILDAEDSWRNVIVQAVRSGLPVPAMASALTFFDGYRSGRLPANLLQAQRDYFGAHTYERVDRSRGEFFHTDWTGTGGDVSSTAYDV
ncbi:MAG: decarboxylating NADP(+)-dependent phosphogluconate dehydrogenase [Spirochaetes bacterium]|nr:decarboxylating NADP(+)-dependent phosphogluconate dehydrogenase [Spirochaetota bacterium]MBN2771947.1 decarboxylating NADP(+)-dependent phosphogluconate dehydrogenase [Spirochaetota bacterium]